MLFAELLPTNESPNQLQYAAFGLELDSDQRLDFLIRDIKAYLSDQGINERVELPKVIFDYIETGTVQYTVMQTLAEIEGR